MKKDRNPGDEISDLKDMLENFDKEKERVREIIGRIGGVPTFNTKLMNVVFIVMFSRQSNGALAK